GLHAGAAVARVEAGDVAGGREREPLAQRRAAHAVHELPDAVGLAQVGVRRRALLRDSLQLRGGRLVHRFVEPVHEAAAGGLATSSSPSTIQRILTGSASPSARIAARRTAIWALLSAAPRA